MPEIDNGDDFNDGNDFEVSLNTGGILVHENQQVTVRFITGPSRGADDLSIDITSPAFRTQRVPLTYDGATINPGTQFADTEAEELLLGLTQKFNLAVTEDKQRPNHFVVSQYYDWILTGNRVDWTERVSNKSYKGILDEQDAILTFADAESDDRLNKLTQDALVDSIYGQHVYTADNEVSTGDSTVGDFFSPLVVAAPSQAGDITKAIEADPQNGIPHLYDFALEDGSKSIQSNIIIGYRKAIDLTSDIYYADSNNNVVTYDRRSFLTLSNTNDAETRDINYSSQGAYSASNALSAYNRYWGQSVNHLYRDCLLYTSPSPRDS